MGRVRDRTFTGCWKCRSRRVKCDETRPACLKCQRIGVICTGYDAKFNWIRGGDDQQPVRLNGRRALSVESTWKDQEVLPSDLVDLLIHRCDETDENAGPSAFFVALPTTHNPFSVFPLATKRRAADTSIDDRCTLRQPPDPFPDHERDERYLFHHYITQVATIMMPYTHPKNPWAIYYPSAALELRGGEQGALYHAILAQAAFNLAQLSGRQKDGRLDALVESARKQYGSAMRHLLPVVSWPDLDFPSAMATILTLMFAELYSGQPQQWRHHFRGVWTLFLERGGDDEARVSSALARVSVQSLMIIKVIGDTSTRETGCAQDFNQHVAATSPQVVAAQEDGSLRRLGSVSEFYFTVGAPSDVLHCISRITAFRNKPHSLRGPDEADELVGSVLGCLRRYRQQDLSLSGWTDTNLSALDFGDGVVPSECIPGGHGDELLGIPDGTGTPPEARLQMQSFIRAAYIFLYRSVLDVPPRAVRQHVRDVFASVSLFLAMGSGRDGSAGNFSLWPAFVAAAEATHAEDIEAARQWIEWAVSFGIGIRTSAKTVLEEVWRRREQLARTTGLEKDLIIIDWVQVMQELDCDVLLI